MILVCFSVGVVCLTSNFNFIKIMKSVKKCKVLMQDYTAEVGRAEKKCENQFLYFVLTTARLHYLAPHPPPHTRSVQFVLTQHALNQGHNTREPTTSNILLYFGCFFFGFVRQAPTPPSPTTTKIKLRSSSCILEQNGLKRF